MATSMKRKHEENINKNNLNAKKLNTTDSSSDKLLKFIEWCEKNEFNISPKVRVGCEGSCAQYGMVAVDDIPEGYCLFQIPRNCLIMPENSDIAELVEKEKQSLSVTNQWIPLLLTLLFETNNPSSKWKPYLDLFPNPDSIDLPIFWESSEVNQLLQGSGVDAAVKRDLGMIQNDFEKLVVPFVQKYSKELSNLKVNQEDFKKMVAFVMAYSFTEPKAKTNKVSEDGLESESSVDSEDEEDQPVMAPPMMVPLADSLNHITDHNAKLTFGKEALKMVAAKSIKKGEEIFNTYGEVSNLHLMHMYGFAEQYPANGHDVVEVPVVRLLEAAQELGQDQTLTSKKCALLKEQAIIIDDDVLVINKDGFVSDEVCLQILKVLAFSQQEFDDYVEREGWSDAESEASVVDDSALSFANLPTVEVKWKQLLLRMAQLHLSHYSTSLEEDEKLLAQTNSMSSREKFSLFTRQGQKKLLYILLDACK
ncbi:N-lysine methyltransferase setd6-like [Biomphalaria glabrata]|uniref:N-lysine methyltransferase n=2 Tax=Biomphalaria glabrata TaxID=6526 RepID=A0A9W2YHG7_BIOGL|nr:N-lysine methyltransferase setd6-like [Biomphalaria glabrata]